MTVNEQSYVRDLKSAIIDLISECEEHNCEYQHSTSRDLLKKYKELLKVDPDLD